LELDHTGSLCVLARHAAAESDFAAVASAADTNLVYIVRRGGQMIALSPTGVIAACPNTKARSRCCAALAFTKDSVFVATSSGSVIALDAQTFCFVRKIPYQTAARNTLGARETVGAMARPSVRQLVVSKCSRKLIVAYSDASLHVLDPYAHQVVQFLAGHFAPITSLEWGGPQQPSLLISTSADQSLCLWNRTASSKPCLIDIPRCIDPALSYMHHLHDGAPNHISRSVVCATCVTWHPDGVQFAVGCNHGVVLVFTTATLATHPLLSYTITTGDSAVEKLSFSPCGLLLATTHVSGKIAVFEATPGAQQVLLVQEPMVPHVAMASKYRGAMWMKVPLGNGVRYLVSSASPSDVAVQRITQWGTAWQSTTECRVTLPAACTAMVLHPSQEYLLLTSHDGTVHIFHLPDGEMRGQIKMQGSPPDAAFLDVDYSGLYLLIAAVRDCSSTVALLEVLAGPGIDR